MHVGVSFGKKSDGRNLFCLPVQSLKVTLSHFAIGRLMDDCDN